MAKLAIEGHKERGKEVIALLEMLGGKNNPVIPYDGSDERQYYFITEEGNINISKYAEGPTEEYIGLTLESFEEQFPYKVGDKVVGRMFGRLSVIGMKWIETIRSILYSVQGVEGEVMFAYAQDLSPYKLDPIERSPDKAKAPVLQGEDYSEGRCGYKIPEGFEFDKVEDGEVILKPKKKEFPKTYGECCEALGFSREGDIVYSGQWIYGYEYLGRHLKVLQSFSKLLICSDAYWKLADDWSFKIGRNSQEVVYAITVWGTGILKDFYHALNCNRILVFPAEEMRDTFYENFKDLINECKELL